MKFVRGLHPADPGTVSPTSGGQFARVVAVVAAGDHDNIAFPRQLDGRLLALFGGTTHGVRETDLRPRKPSLERVDHGVHVRRGLRGLRDDSEARAFRESSEIVFGEHNVALGQVVRQPSNFDVISFSDYDGVIARVD